ncbi:hypothetical protein EB796_022143 [Bugula neritina]|uniref:Uncharacterized protein n=1 Tax=Bugula neritina TaxID=10212 RepID=A0A7J7J082_BUGNE|nr:hypothetical protein EB796_022143 [Bugula neritina]
MLISLEIMGSWKHMGKAYLRAICVCVQKVLHNFQSVLLSDEQLSRFGIQSRMELLYSLNLVHLDDILLRVKWYFDIVLIHDFLL